MPLRLPDPAFQRRGAPGRYSSDEISLQILAGSGDLLRNIQEEFERKIRSRDRQSHVDEGLGRIFLISLIVAFTRLTTSF
jgi:hypothetical protein